VIATGWRRHSITPWEFRKEEPKILEFRYTTITPMASTAPETKFLEIKGNFVAVKALIPKAKAIKIKASPTIEPRFRKKRLPGIIRDGRLQQKKLKMKKKNRKAKSRLITFLVSRYALKNLWDIPIEIMPSRK